MLGPSAPRRTRMIRPTDNLRSDHATIARGLDALAAIAAEVRAGGPFPAAECAVLLRFLREFVVGVHLHKEAAVVWPAVAVHGDEALAGAVGEAMRLHDEIVELSHSLVLFWEPIGELSPEERVGFADTVDAVVGRVQRVATLDEQRLFPACEAGVPPDDRVGWAAEFARIDAARTPRAAWCQRLAPLLARWVR
jgi:hemerythrin-like domain-containing protein